ncbi:MAG UNVERIFIED_CONTAM: hypothetical protein LVR18_43205 [Planctomycetaceae bacterium]|jgi:hypothetical protein
MLNFQDTLLVGGWVIGTELVDIDLPATNGIFSLTVDQGASFGRRPQSGC